MNFDFIAERGCVSPPPASPEMISRAERELGIAFPDSYRSLVQFTNGLCGDFGGAYLDFIPVESLATYNREYGFPEFAPGLISFATNGGGEGYCFDTRTSPFPVVVTPFIGMSLRDSISVAPSFSTFLKRLSNGEELW